MWCARRSVGWLTRVCCAIGRWDGTARRALADVASAAAARIGVEVNIARISRDDWDAAEPTRFLATVKGRPMVALLNGDG